MWGTTDQQQRFGSIWPLWHGPHENQDRRKAVELLDELVKEGYIPAVCALAEAYFDGEGVTKDYQKAFDLHHRAAEQGYPSSEGAIGNFFIMASPSQHICEYDPEQSVHWYKLAANHGNHGAQYNLAVSYEQGRGTEVDLVNAFIWANLAAHCSPLRFRPAETLRDKIKPTLTESELIDTAKQISQLCEQLPLPWSEHFTYWKKLATDAGTIAE